jgi:D-lactate dehydrogenase (cytochrome)
LIEEEFAEKWKDIPEDVEKREVVLKLREELAELFDSLGAVHLQIGKFYKFSSLMKNDSLWKLLNGVKDLLDPDRKVNPGSLGLR